jgi:hypothetical protein
MVSTNSLHLELWIFAMLNTWYVNLHGMLTLIVITCNGPNNVYKDMLHNMVSPIDHVFMNH